MNKIKFLYDVVTTMKGKEAVKGIVKVEGKRDQDKIFRMENEFEKDLVNGHTRSKMMTEMDADGKKMRHESTTEFDLENCHAHHHGFMGHMHNHDHNHGFGGPRKGLNRIAFLLSVLNSIKVDEKENNSYLLSLNLDELPEDMKNTIHEKMKEGKMHGHHGHPGFAGQFHGMEDPKLDINMFINNNFEIEKVVLNVEGQQKDDSASLHEMNIAAELNFSW